MRNALFLALLLSTAAAATPSLAGEIVLKPTTVQDMKAVFGQVESRDTAPARVRTGGTLVSRTVEEGSVVKAGDVIAVVADEKLALQLQAVDARLKALDAQLDNARTELERGQSLVSRGAVTQSRLDQLKTSVDVLQNQIEAAKADRAVIEQQSTEGQVLAPKDGRVLTVPAAPGSVVLPGETVARIAAGGYFLRLALPERHAARIKAGDPVSVGERGLGPAATDSAPRRTGRIVKVYPELEGGRVLADVEVEGLGDFFVGERVPVWIPVAERTALTVPANAVMTRNGIDYVRVVGDGGPLDVPVILGRATSDAGDKRIEVLSGLRAGDRVVTP
ncbi:efflux RND transporter periplasmic adaptor subunit [Alsobacter sp. SYSU M60028]|uniref:Efflux RND transporter periplasmic adaptor subunit n=1 Tax=Alsobacter ponti TaxID=2962936 RepID=A0ABT1LG41_9HYPH|nr:efflux RND transporter periplasmic adaptor subunit [Alsobacter ponti]MCP8940471.1 efflux RND transporter periplasmic adaptor subunit [Alsobacter ponti]